MEYQLGTSIVNTDLGKIEYDDSILLSIINLSTKEIEGVTCLKDNFSHFAKRWFSGKYYDGVKVVKDGESYTIDIYIEVDSTNPISEIAYRIQENVKNGISYMMDIIIKAINIHVVSVKFSDV